MNLSKENISKIRGLIVFTAIVIVALWQHSIFFDIITFVLGIAMPFLVGGSIAFILNVPMSFIERNLFGRIEKRRKKPLKAARPLSLLGAIIFIIGIMALVIFIVVPELGRTFVQLGNAVTAFIPTVQSWINDQFYNNPNLVEWANNLQVDWSAITNGIIHFFQDGAGNILGSTIDVVTNIVSGVVTALIAVVFAIYVLHQKEKLNMQKRKAMFAYLPKRWVEKSLEVGNLAYKTFANFITGQCTEALILGTVFFIMMTVFRLPYPLLIAVLIAFCSLIPMFGTFIAFAIGSILIVIVSPLQALIFAIMFIILQQLESSFLYPRVMGSSVGLPSIWVLAAVSLGGSLMGFIGMLIAIPIVSVAYTLFRANIHKRLRKRNITEADYMVNPGEKKSP